MILRRERLKKKINKILWSEVPDHATEEVMKIIDKIVGKRDKIKGYMFASGYLFPNGDTGNGEGDYRRKMGKGRKQ